jgi:hypothetical protein
MADFALWATACETAWWPAGTFKNAYWVNRRSAVESIIEADPVAQCVRELMEQRITWAGTASTKRRRARVPQASDGRKTARAGGPAAASANIPVRTGHRDYSR